MDISNAHNFAVVYQVRLQFHTSIYGTIMKQLLHKNSPFLMIDFRHSSTLNKPAALILGFLVTIIYCDLESVYLILFITFVY